MWPPDNKYLRPNLAALARQGQPEAAQAIGQAPPPAGQPNLEIFATPQGPVLGYRGQALASRINPLKEAQSLAQAHSFTGTPLVFGWGSGYHLLSLAERYAFLWVVEPRPIILRAALTLTDYRAYWPQIRLIAGRAGALARPWPEFMITHAPSRRLNPEEYAYWQSRLTWPTAESLPATLAPWPDLAAQAANMAGPDAPIGPAGLFNQLPEQPLTEGRLLLALLLLLNKTR